VFQPVCPSSHRIPDIETALSILGNVRAGSVARLIVTALETKKLRRLPTGDSVPSRSSRIQ
jgi:hypothetical protein